VFCCPRRTLHLTVRPQPPRFAGLPFVEDPGCIADIQSLCDRATGQAIIAKLDDLLAIEMAKSSKVAAK